MQRLSELGLSHEDYVTKVQSGQLNVRVNKSAAGYLFKGPLSHHAGHQASLRFISFACLALGIGLFFFVPWWYAAAFVVFGLFMVSRAQRHAVDAVTLELLADEDFYNAVLASDVDLVRVEQA